MKFSDDEQPLSGELLTIDLLKQHAHGLAQKCRVSCSSSFGFLSAMISAPLLAAGIAVLLLMAGRPSSWASLVFMLCG